MSLTRARCRPWGPKMARRNTAIGDHFALSPRWLPSRNPIRLPHCLFFILSYFRLSLADPHPCLPLGRSRFPLVPGMGELQVLFHHPDSWSWHPRGPRCITPSLPAAHLSPAGLCQVPVSSQSCFESQQNDEMTFFFPCVEEARCGFTQIPPAAQAHVTTHPETGQPKSPPG